MTMINGYEQSDREESLDILNLPSLEARAKQIIPAGGFGYMVDCKFNPNFWTNLSA